MSDKKESYPFAVFLFAMLLLLNSVPAFFYACLTIKVCWNLLAGDAYDPITMSQAYAPAMVLFVITWKNYDFVRPDRTDEEKVGVYIFKLMEVYTVGAWFMLVSLVISLFI